MVAVFVSCGLPTSDYLYPPSNFFGDNSTITLVHKDDNVSTMTTFLGYEIYYRLFQNFDDAKTALSDILNLAATYSNNPDAFMNSVKTYSMPFYRMQKSYSDSGKSDIDSSKPLLPAKADIPFTFTINLSGWTVDIGNNTLVTVVRNNGSSNINSAKFSLISNYAATDQDYSAGMISPPNSVYLVVFAVSYGTSASSLSDVYSSPVIFPSSTDGSSIIQLTLN